MPTVLKHAQSSQTYLKLFFFQVIEKNIVLGMFKCVKKSEQGDESEKLKRMYNTILGYRTFFTQISVFFLILQFIFILYINKLQKNKRNA